MRKIINFLVSTTIFVNVFLCASNFPLAIHSFNPSLLPWHTYLIQISVCLTLFFVTGKYKTINKNVAGYVLWYSLFIGICVSSLLFVRFDDSALEIFIKHSWIAALSCSFVLLIDTPRNVSVAGVAIVLSTLLVSSISLMEFFNIDFTILSDDIEAKSKQAGYVGRVGGLFVNANANATALVFGMCVGIPFVHSKLKVLFVALVGCAVLTTFSRSGIVLWVSGVIAISFLRCYRSSGAIINGVLMLLLLGLGVTVVTGIGASIIAYLNFDAYLTQEMIDRLSSNIFTQYDTSSIVRKEMILEGFNLFWQNPLYGTGLGTSEVLGPDSDQGPHNMWLSIAMELGITGIVVYSFLAIIIFRANDQFAYFIAIMFLFAGFFSHNLIDETITAVILPLGVVLIPIVRLIRVYRI